MTDADKREFGAILYALGEMYEINLHNDRVVQMWFEALSSYDIDEIASAVTRHTRRPDPTYGKPKPGDIIAMIEGTSADNAFLAWSKFVEALRTIGTYSSVVFDDPIIHRVIDDMGGWCSFSGLKDKDLPFVGKEFMARYRAFKAKGVIPSHSKKLIGQDEARQLLDNFTDYIAPPVYVGEKEKALLVQSGQVAIAA